MERCDRGAYQLFFATLTGHEPYEYQTELAICERLPDVLVVPTGGGKTDAVIVQWLWRLRTDAHHTSHRLVYCLPMRVLVDQTFARARTILDKYASQGGNVPAISVLMGSVTPEPWEREALSPCLLIGTQDMLISRALNQGYGMSYYRRPVDFGLLNADTLWVLDEIQLMGPAFKTSVQLQAFRQSQGTVGSCSTLWMSATTSGQWFKTTDSALAFEPGGPRTLEAGFAGSDLDSGCTSRLQDLSNAEKPVSVLRKITLKEESGTGDYVSLLADDVAQRRAGPTIVVVNTVQRAILLYQQIKAKLRARGDSTEVLLLHSRFRRHERILQQARLEDLMGSASDCVVVSTQVIEAGVDVSCQTMYTELAPLSSLVQRFGRCNRRNEYREREKAHIYLTPIDGSAHTSVCLPYDWEALQHAQAAVDTIPDACPSVLTGLSFDPIEGAVLSKEQFDGFVRAEQDIQGNVQDPSVFIRTASADGSLRLFWRDFAEKALERQPPPDPEEICAVPLKQGLQYLKRLQTRPEMIPAGAWVYDEERGAWAPLAECRDWEGEVVMVSAAAGGYSRELGFNGTGATGPVEPVVIDRSRNRSAGHQAGVSPQLLSDHLERSWKQAHVMTEALAELQGCDAHMMGAIREAALLHDIGKADARFQDALGNRGTSVLLAKAPTMDWRRLKGLRHELESDLYLSKGGLQLNWTAGSQQPEDFADNPDPRASLVRYLIRAHHGRIRRTIAAGLSGGGSIMGISAGFTGPALDIRTPSWSIASVAMQISNADVLGLRHAVEREHRDLVRDMGVFRLGYAEAIVRVIDWLASADDQEKALERKGDA